MKKIVVIAGPTAIGKSELGVTLSEKFNGEVVSADSRQIYQGLNIGTGKITEKERRGIPHHLLDLVSPQETWSAAEYQKHAHHAIAMIHAKKHTPFIVGGTGFYAVLFKPSFPEVPPNKEYRGTLQPLPTEALYDLLKERDLVRAENIDPKNRVRLIRALEVIRALGKVPPLPAREPMYEALIIGLTLPMNELRLRINERLKDRLQAGMIEEARELYTHGLSWERMRELGLEYRAMADFLTHKISREAMTHRLEQEILTYAKRQMTWFKRNKKIQWFSPVAEKTISTEVKNFLLE